MGTKVSYILMSLFCALFIGCSDDRGDTEYAQFPLSEDAKRWFSGVHNERDTFKSTNGLSDVYQITLSKFNPLIHVNGQEGYGEQTIVECIPTLGDDKFGFTVSNSNTDELIQFEYSRIKQWFLLNSPYTEVFFDGPYYYQMQQSVLEYIGDTVLNKVQYRDIYRNDLLIEEMPGNVKIAREIYLSKSQGLVAFSVLDSVVWYKK